MNGDSSQGILLHRPERTWPVPARSEPIKLAAPPSAPEDSEGSALQTMLPMLGSMGIIAFAIFMGSAVFILVAAFMVIAMVSGGVLSRRMQKRKAQRKRKQTRERYLEHAARAEDQAATAASLQRAGLEGRFPDTAGLLGIVQESGATWERRAGDEDFGSVRLGLGAVPASAPVVVQEDSGPLTTPEPELDEVADRLVAGTAALPDAPVVVPLTRLGTLAVVGDPGDARDLVGSWVASLAALHAPGELRIAGYVPPRAARSWEWVKWLPHTRDPMGGEGFGRGSRAVTTDMVAFAEQIDLVVGQRTEALQRAQEARGGQAGAAEAIPEEHVVVVVDGYSPLSEVGFVKDLDVLMERASKLKATVVVLVERSEDVPAHCGARVDFTGEATASYREAGPAGRVETSVRFDRVDRRSALMLARHLAPQRLAGGEAGGDLGDSVRELELLGYDNAEHLEPWQEWMGLETLRQRPAALLRVPIGMGSNGETCELDLKESAAEGMGPHGVLIGATGSGKSELLRSLATALAIRHSPELLNFVLADFKGGAAFAELADLPHTAGLITNLADDLAMIDRMQAALNGELARRQELLRQAGNLDSLRDYHAVKARNPSLPNLPYLVVIVDEFSELLSARPEFLDTFVAIGRLGRSLGMHLLMASQRLDEGRLRGLEGHLRYRLGLRTFSAQESKTVLGSAVAYELPAIPGLGYLKVDTDMSRFKASLVSLPHRPPVVEEQERAAASVLQPFALAAERPQQSAGSVSEPGADRESELTVLVRRMAEAGTGVDVHKVWLPPLPTEMTLGQLEQDYSRTLPSDRMVAEAGLVDRPGDQEQTPLRLDFSGAGGNLGICGAPRSGKSTFVRTLITSLVRSYGPDEAQFYCIDLGGGTLYALGGLPHVGAVVGRSEPDTVGRLLREVRALIDDRAAAFRTEGVGSLAALRAKADRTTLPAASLAEVFLVVDNVGLMRQTMPDQEAEVGEIAASGLPYGVHVVTSAGRWMDVRSSLLDATGARLELRLNDPTDSQSGRAVASQLPADTPGRGLTRDGEQFQTALPAMTTEPERVHEQAELDELIEQATRRAGPLHAPRIRPLPEKLHASEVPALAQAAGNPPPPVEDTDFLLGLEEFRSRPVYFDPLAPGTHLLLYGDTGAGRTTQLRRLIRHLAASRDPARVRLHLVDIGRDLVDFGTAEHVQTYAYTNGAASELATKLAEELRQRMPPDTLTPQQLLAGDWWSGPEHVLIIDDYELTLGPSGSPFMPLGDMLGMASDIGFHIFMVRQVAGQGRSAFETFGSKVRDAGPIGLVMSGNPGEGQILGQQVARPQPPGRGYLVRRGRPTALVQCCLDEVGEEVATGAGAGRGRHVVGTDREPVSTGADGGAVGPDGGGVAGPAWAAATGGGGERDRGDGEPV